MADLLTRYHDWIERYLDGVLYDVDQPYAGLLDAMKYSLMAGGKRIRPVLVLEFCRLCGGDPDKAMPFAAAIEMVHTMSLIHDDLPCMDNDDFRRGRPSCHKAHGEDVALIAGDALLTEAFYRISQADLPPERIALAVERLAVESGALGMVGGQMIDISKDKSELSDEDMLQMYALKTSCLLSAACQLGCIAAGRFDACKNAADFAYNLGLAFQIRDDILDEIGDSARLGKPTGSDQKNGKETFLARVGMAKAEELVCSYSDAAKKALALFGEDAADLLELTDKLMQRDR